MAYAQWIYMVIKNLMKSGDLKFKNTKLNWGKFYRWDNKDDEISGGDVENEVVNSGGEKGIASCGRSDAASGTDGSYDIYDGDTKVCHVTWDCPWGTKTNTFIVSDIDNNYVVQATGQNFDSGAIGTVTIKVVKLG